MRRKVGNKGGGARTASRLQVPGESPIGGVPPLIAITERGKHDALELKPSKNHLYKPSLLVILSLH